MTSTEAAYAAVRIMKRTFAIAYAVCDEGQEPHVVVEAEPEGSRFPLDERVIRSDAEADAFIAECNDRVNAYFA